MAKWLCFLSKPMNLVERLCLKCATQKDGECKLKEIKGQGITADHASPRFVSGPDIMYKNGKC